MSGVFQHRFSCVFAFGVLSPFTARSCLLPILGYGCSPLVALQVLPVSSALDINPLQVLTWPASAITVIFRHFET